MMREPYYQDDFTTIYHGDCREILPALPPFDSLIVDPVWPDANIGMEGQDRAHELFKEMWDAMLVPPTRAAVQVGCYSDVRFFSVVPTSLAFFRYVDMEIPRKSYRGRLLVVGDMCCLFGTPPPSKPGRRVVPGRCFATSAKGKETEHPCPRKIQHVEWLVGWWSAEGDTIVDPFCGSGTTMLAAKTGGRKSIGIEIDERYCEMSAKRMQQEVFDFGGTN